MELVLPQNYVEIEQEEMMYLDGGYRSSKQIWVPSSTIRMSYDDYMKKSTYKSIAVGALLGLIPGYAGIAIGAITSMAMYYYDKGKVQKYDMADGELDYYLKIDIPGKYITVYNPYPRGSYEGAIW